MSLPRVNGQFGIVADPDVKFSDAGKCWVKLRCVAKKRIRDKDGQWTDGDPTFIDVVCFGKPAEHLVDSVAKGDTILVTGDLEQQNWKDKDGNDRSGFRIVADEIGVSTVFGPAKSKRVLEAEGVSVAKDILGGVEIPDPEDPPF